MQWNSNFVYCHPLSFDPTQSICFNMLFLFLGPTGNQSQDSGLGSYFDPTLFIILGAMALMFIVMCVVLQLFAK
jgi:hypothetical protein